MSIQYSSGSTHSLVEGCLTNKPDPVFAAHRANAEIFARRHGTVIGTGGVAAVSIRLDHNPDAIPGAVANAHRDFGIPATLALYSRQREVSTSEHSMPWADIQQDLCFELGMEPASHSATHDPRTNLAGFVDEIQTSLIELKAQLPGCAVEMWTQPGITDANGQKGYGGFYVRDRREFTELPAGRLVLEDYAASSSYGDLGSGYWELDGRPSVGLGHITIEKMTYTEAKAKITQAQSNGVGVNLMLHPDNVGKGGDYMSASDYRLLLQFIAQERDAGRLMPLTMSGMALADKSSTHRLDVVTNGDFSAVGTGFTGWTHSGSWSLQGSSPNNLSNTPSTTVEGDWIRQAVTVPAENAGAVYELSVDLWWYTNVGGADGEARIKLRDNGSVLDKTITIPTRQAAPTRHVSTHVIDRNNRVISLWVYKNVSGGRLFADNVKWRAV
ncbi:hypothetical protein K0651_01815 [Ornithinimicrobium sp. Arc0846-15]|nr:hypothetical protein [Ornithinimicrobium laminariae]